MVVPLFVSIGMPRAGSGWHYNLIHDLVVASGGVDARWVRKRFLLQAILTQVNCNIGAFTLKRLVPALVPSFLGIKYVIKAHAGPTSLVKKLIQQGRIIPAYVYRDPRDALLSAYEYGQRKRQTNRKGAFAELVTIEDSIFFMNKYVEISESWLDIEQIYLTRYEDLLLNYRYEAECLAKSLNIDPNQETVSAIIDYYEPNKGNQTQIGLHFQKGKIGRYREALSSEQQALCIETFGSYLEKMKYPR